MLCPEGEMELDFFYMINSPTRLQPSVLHAGMLGYQRSAPLPCCVRGDRLACNHITNTVDVTD